MDVLENVAEPPGKQNPEGIRSQNVYTQTTAKKNVYYCRLPVPSQLTVELAIGFV